MAPANGAPRDHGHAQLARLGDARLEHHRGVPQPVEVLEVLGRHHRRVNERRAAVHRGRQRREHLRHHVAAVGRVEGARLVGGVGDERGRHREAQLVGEPELPQLVARRVVGVERVHEPAPGEPAQEAAQGRGRLADAALAELGIQLLVERRRAQAAAPRPPRRPSARTRAAPVSRACRQPSGPSAAVSVSVAGNRSGIDAHRGRPAARDLLRDAIDRVEVVAAGDEQDCARCRARRPQSQLRGLRGSSCSRRRRTDTSA